MCAQTSDLCNCVHQCSEVVWALKMGTANVAQISVHEQRQMVYNLRSIYSWTNNLNFINRTEAKGFNGNQNKIFPPFIYYILEAWQGRMYALYLSAILLFVYLMMILSWNANE